MSSCNSKAWCSSCLYAQIEMKRKRLVEGGQLSRISQPIQTLIVLPEVAFIIEQTLLTCCWIFHVYEPSSALFRELHNIQNLVSLKPGKPWSVGFAMEKK